jgi:O-antigen/teichoic acid export membrane protein
MSKSRSAKVLILSSGQALTSLVGLISMAVLTRVFSKLDYATYRQTMLAFTFAVPFVTLGLDRALYLFLPGEQKRPRALLVENLLLLVLAGGTLSLFILLGGNHLLARRLDNPDLASILLLLVPYPLLMLPASAMTACLMARDRAEQIAGFNVVSRLLMLALVLLPVLFWTTPAAAIAGTVAGAAITTVAALVLMFRACPSGPWRPRWSSMWAQLTFAVPLGLATLVGTVSVSLDQMLVSLRCPPEVFAVYSVGSLEIPLIGIITGSITSVVLVDYARYYREARIGEIVALVHRAMSQSATLLVPIMVFLLCVAPDLMCVLFGEKYRDSSVPFRVFLLLLPVRTITFGAVLQAAGQSRHILIQSILGLGANAVLAWWAIGWIGPVGACWASVVTTYLVSVPYLMSVMRSALRVPYRRMFPWNDLLKIMVTTIVPGAATLAVMSIPWVPDVVRLAVGTAVYGGILVPILVLSGHVRPGDIVQQVQSLIGGGAKQRQFAALPSVSPRTSGSCHSANGVNQAGNGENS